MRKLLLVILAAGAVIGGASTADAAQGCGRGFHRGPYGHCRPNGRVLVGPGVRVGVFYPGRGYWDGRRYWWHRERWHGGWRYR